MEISGNTRETVCQVYAKALCLIQVQRFQSYMFWQSEYIMHKQDI